MSIRLRINLNVKKTPIIGVMMMMELENDPRKSFQAFSEDDYGKIKIFR